MTPTLIIGFLELALSTVCLVLAYWAIRDSNWINNLCAIALGAWSIMCFLQANFILTLSTYAWWVANGSMQ